MSPDVDVASTRAGEPRVQYDVLARALPALSYAAGANEVPVVGKERNFDLEVHGRGHLWPRAGGRWLHMDVRNVALPYLYQTYEEMIRRGALR